MKSKNQLFKPFNFLDVPFVFITAYLIFVIFKQHQPIIYDQYYVRYGLNPFAEGWPSWDALTSKVIIQIIGLLFRPSAENINGVMRGFACFSLLTGYYLIVREFVGSVGLRYLGLGLLILSGFPFLWISTEVVAASFLLLFLFAWLKDFPPIVIAFFGVLFALSRADLSLMTAALGILMIGMSKRPKSFGLRFIFFGVIFFFLLNLPGLLAHRFEEQFPASHAIVSVGQHIGVMFNVVQIHPLPDPWSQWLDYKAAVIPHADSLKQMLTEYKQIYHLFVAANIGLLLFMLAKMIHLFLIPWLVTFFREIKIKNTDLIFKKVYLFLTISLIGFIPILLFASPHERYMTGFYVLFLIFALIFLDRLVIRKNKYFQIAVYLILIGILFSGQGHDAWRALTHPGQYETYWDCG